MTDSLRRAGFDAVNIAGGMRAWAAAGHGVVSESGSSGAVI
jgi:rhodanese-related sulfurtransferase